MASQYARPASLVEVGGETGRLNFGEGRISGVRVGEVIYSELFDAVRHLLGAIVIASGGEEIIYPGDEWPGIPNLVASSVSVEPRGKSGETDDWGTVLPHARARLTVNYSTPNWGSNTGGSGGPEDEPFMIEDVDYSCETLSVPVKLTDGSNTKETKRHFRIPTITYTVEIPKLRNPNWALINSLNGKVNTQTVFGGPAGTVLFDGPKIGREVHLVGEYAWKAKYKFIYNRFGWNKQIHPDTLTWVDVTAVASANKLYETADLRDLWKNIQL